MRRTFFFLCLVSIVAGGAALEAAGTDSVSEEGLFLTDPKTNVYEYLLFAPPDFYEDWCWYVRQRKATHPNVRFAVKNAAAVYAEHPFGSGLPCRNAAESLHAYIRTAWTNGVLEYVVLGGAWLDAQNTLGYQPRFATGEALSLSNSVPGVYGYPREDWRAIPADYFYACPGLAAGEKYPWDANGNGKYIDQNDCAKNDLVPRLCVSRLTLNPYNGGREPYNRHALVTNYVAKLRRGEAKTFAGHYRYGMSAASTGSSKQRKTGDRMYYRELEFYDGMLNMFDPRHHDTLEDCEYSVRVRTVDQYSMWRPVREVKGMMSYTWTGGLPSLSAAMDDYYAADRDFAYVQAHGWAQGAAQFSAGRFATAKGLTLFNGGSGPCETGYPDYYVNKVLQYNVGDAAVTNPDGGALASVNNSRWSWAGGGGYGAMSYYMLNEMLIGFNKERLDVGHAWLKGCRNYYPVSHSGSTATWVLTEQILYGDPLVRLPEVPNVRWTGGETGVWDRVTANWTNSVGTAATFDAASNVYFTVGTNLALDVAGEIAAMRLSLPVFGEDAVISLAGTGTLRVLQAVDVAGTNATLKFNVAGGVGHSGIRFLTGAGDLVFEGTNGFYVGGVSNAKRLSLLGGGVTLDADEFPTTFNLQPSTFNLLFDGTGEPSIPLANVLRSKNVGGLKRFGSLAITNSYVKLSTVDAFGRDAPATHTLVNSELEIGANVYYQRSGFPEGLNATFLVDGDSAVTSSDGGLWTVRYATTFALGDDSSLTLAAETVNAGGKIVITNSSQHLSPHSPLLTNSVTVANASALSGDVTVGAGIRLVLDELPLKSVTSLTIGKGAAVELPDDASGYWQIVPVSSKLACAEDVTFATASDPFRPLDGSPSPSGSFFREGALYRWTGAEGTWNRSFSIRHPKILFGELAGNVTTVRVASAVSPDFAFFSNLKTPYVFAPADEVAGVAFSSVYFCGPTAFEVPVAATEYVEVSTATSRFSGITAPYVHVASGAGLALAGSHWTDFQLDAGAALVAVPGEALDWNTETTFAFPDDGVVLVDVGGLELSDEPQALIAGFGHDWTIPDLQQFRLVGSAAEFRIVDGALCVVRGDNLKGPYELRLDGSTNWNNSAWTAAGTAAAGRRALPAPWGSCALDWTADAVVTVTNVDAFVSNASAVLTLDCDVHLNSLAIHTGTKGLQLTTHGSAVHPLSPPAFSLVTLDLTDCKGAVTIDVETGSAAIVTPTNESAVCRFARAGSGTVTLNGSTVELSVPGEWTLANGSQGRLRVVVTQGLSRFRLAKLPANFEDGGLEVEFVDSEWNALSGFSAEFSEGALWCVPPPIFAVVPSGTNEFQNLPWRDHFGNAVSRADFEKASARLLIGGDNGGVLIATNGFASVLSTLSISNAVTFYGSETFAPSAWPGPGTLELAGAFTVKADVRANNMLLTNARLKLSDASTLEISHGGVNCDATAQDWSGVTGTGRIRFTDGTASWLAAPGRLFAATLSVETSSDLVLTQTIGPDNPFGVANLSGAGSFRSDWGNGCMLRPVRTVQTGVSEYRGKLSALSSKRDSTLIVGSDAPVATTNKALILSGSADSVHALDIETNGCVILTGTWKGAIRVSGLLVITNACATNGLTVTANGNGKVQEIAADELPAVTDLPAYEPPAYEPVEPVPVPDEPETGAVRILTARLGAGSSKWSALDWRNTNGVAETVIDWSAVTNVTITATNGAARILFDIEGFAGVVHLGRAASPLAAALTVEVRKTCPFTLAADSTGAVDFRLAPVPTATCDLLLLDLQPSTSNLQPSTSITVHDRYGREVDVPGEVAFDAAKGKYVFSVQNIDRPNVSNTFDTQYDDTLSASLGFSGSGGLTFKDYPKYFEKSRAGRALIGTSKEQFKLYSHNGNPTVDMDGVYVWSINFVVKLPTNDRGIVFGWGNKDAGNGLALVRVSENRAGIYAWKDGGAATLVASANVPSASTQFHSYAITHDAHMLCFYVDGALAESVSLEGKYPTRGFYQYFKMYGQNGGLSDGPSSVVDDFRLYLNCCLTPASVRAIANAFKPWPEYPSAEVDLPNLAWSNLYWSADRQADDSLTLVGGAGSLRLDAPVELSGSLAVTDGKVPVAFAGDGALVVRGGVTVASSLELDVSGLDGAALAAKTVCGVPYSRWLVRGCVAGDVKVLDPLPAMPHGYTVETEVNARFGVRLIVTAPWFAKYRSLNFNFAGGDKNAENTAARVSDQAGCKNLMHGAFPMVGTAWTDLPARDQTVDASGVKLVVSGVNNPYCTKTSVGDQILYGYLDDKQHPTVVVSNIPYASYRIVTYHATDNANTYFCPVWMGSTAADAVRYFGPSVNAATGGASVWGWSDVSWGDSDCRAALAEGVNYVISDVITGEVGKATAYVRVPRLATGRACLTALQIVEVGEVFVSKAVDYTATVTNDTLWANGDGAGLVHDTAWVNDTNSLIKLMPAARPESAPYRTVTFDTPITASTIRVVSSEGERLGLVRTEGLPFAVDALDLMDSKGETVFTTNWFGGLTVATAAGSRLRFTNDATEPQFTAAGAIVSYRRAVFSKTVPSPDFNWILCLADSDDAVTFANVMQHMPIDVRAGVLTLPAADAGEYYYGGNNSTDTNSVLTVSGGRVVCNVTGKSTDNGGANRGMIIGVTSNVSQYPTLVVAGGEFDCSRGLLAPWERGRIIQSGGVLKAYGIVKGGGYAGSMALNGGTTEIGAGGIGVNSKGSGFAVTLAGGTIKAVDTASVPVALSLTKPSSLVAIDNHRLTLAGTVTGSGTAALTIGAPGATGEVVIASAARLGNVTIAPGVRVTIPFDALTGDLTVGEGATLNVTKTDSFAAVTNRICAGTLTFPASAAFLLNGAPLPKVCSRDGDKLIVNAERRTWTNPVTGESLSFSYRFVGAESGNWQSVANWRKVGLLEWQPLPGDKVPMTEGSATWDATVIDGADITNVANRAVALSAKMEGWTPQLAVFNAATVTVSTIKKLQGSPKWFWVDATSQLRFDAFGADSYDGTTDLSVAGSNGLVFASNPAGSASSSTTFRYFLKGAGTVEYPGVALTKCAHQICRADFALAARGAGKTVRTKPLVRFASASVGFSAQDAAVAVSDPADEISATARKDVLSSLDALGSYVITQRTDGVYLDYVDRTSSSNYLHAVDWSNGVRHVEIPVDWILQLTNVTDHALPPHDLTPARLARALDETLAANGLKPWESFVLGLEPTNATDRITADIRLSDGQVHVEAQGLLGKRFRGISKVRYILEAADSLTNSFSVIRTPQDESNFPDVPVGTGSARFYRVRIEFVW